MRIRTHSFATLTVGLCLHAAALAGHAQVVKPNVQSIAPCCAITSIDGETGIVTARVTATRRALAFKVTDATLLRSLRVGQTISADLGTRRVAVNGLVPCCEIVTLEPDGVDPCCAITGINAATGLVTARIAATGRDFTFKVANAALLPALRIGQGIGADFPANRVSVYPADPCCTIVSGVPAEVPAAVAKPAVPPPAKAAATPAAAAAPASLGTHPYEVDGVEVVLVSVQRSSGNALTVRWQLRNTTTQSRKVGESFPGMGWSEPFSLIYDAYLLDGRTRYAVQKDESGNLLGMQHGGGKAVTIAANQTLAIWARFAAPPPTTTKITVFIPGTEPFEDVTISAATTAPSVRQRR